MSKLRVRFAPSPHGGPHAGNIRTAILNWLFARKFEGQFIVRLDDTNRERNIPESIDLIRETLVWLGLDWEEGFEKEGEYGPYVQSERLDIYRYYVDNLLSQGLAYRCNCSFERLIELRESQKRNRLALRYDGYCRNKLASDISLGESHVIRFKSSPAGTTQFEDLIRGPISLDNNQTDDFILFRSNGIPTYHFAVVIDDHLMKISHIIRADSLIPSTPKHIMLYNAFGWTVPVFAHFPLVLGVDGKRLSKHGGSIAILDFRNLGYLPESLFNFLALLGRKSELIESGAIWRSSQLIESFNLQTVGLAASIFSHDKLRWLNGVYIRNMNSDDFMNRLTNYYNLTNKPYDIARLSIIAPHIQQRVEILKDAVDLLDFLFRDDFEPQIIVSDNKLRSDDQSSLLSKTRESLISIDEWNEYTIEAGLADVLGSLEAPNYYFGLLRKALTGQENCPPIFPSMAALGKENTLHRIERTVQLLR